MFYCIIIIIIIKDNLSSRFASKKDPNQHALLESRNDIENLDDVYIAFIYYLTAT